MPRSFLCHVPEKYKQFSEKRDLTHILCHYNGIFRTRLFMNIYSLSKKRTVGDFSELFPSGNNSVPKARKIMSEIF